MYALISAIQRKFAGDGTLAQVTGGLFLFRAPSGVAMPYAVLTPVGTLPPGYTTGTAYTQPVSIQISVFAKPPELAAKLGQLVRDSFNWQPLPMDEGRCLMARLANEMLLPDEERDEAGQDVAHYMTEFEFTQQRNHT